MTTNREEMVHSAQQYALAVGWHTGAGVTSTRRISIRLGIGLGSGIGLGDRDI